MCINDSKQTVNSHKKQAIYAQKQPIRLNVCYITYI